MANRAHRSEAVLKRQRQVRQAARADLRRISLDLTGRQPAWPASARAAFLRAMRFAIGQETAWATPPQVGMPLLRDQLGQQLGANSRSILVTCGARAAATALARRHRVVLHERPGFAGTVAALQAGGADVQLLCREDLLDAAAHDTRAAIWINGACRNPDGARISAAARESLAAFAAAGGALIVNESYRWHVPNEPDIPGATYVGTLSKLASGGARVGWIRYDGALSDLEPAHHALPPAAWQLAWGFFIANGGLERLVEHIVDRACAARRAFAAAAGLTNAAQGGPFLFLLPQTIGQEVKPALAAAGIRAGNGADFLAEAAGARLCFSAVNLHQATAGGRRFKHVVRAPSKEGFPWT